MRNAGLHDAHLRLAAPTSFTDSYIAPTGHTYGDGVVTQSEPTCTREGEMTYTCSCGKTHTEPIAKLAHSYVPQIVEPTCTELGYTAYVCAHCGDRTTGDYVRELGHDWNAGTVVQAPRLTKEGLLEQTCRRCGAGAEDGAPGPRVLRRDDLPEP